MGGPGSGRKKGSGKSAVSSKSDGQAKADRMLKKVLNDRAKSGNKNTPAVVKQLKERFDHMYAGKSKPKTIIKERRTRSDATWDRVSKVKK